MREALRESAQDLATRLSEAGFEPRLTELIQLAVPLTRLGVVGADTEKPSIDLKLEKPDSEKFDGAGVIVSFNSVNRIANGLGLMHEWAVWRRWDWLRLASQKPMSILLSRTMPLATTHSNLSLRDAFQSLDRILQSNGWRPLPDYWNHRLVPAHLLETYGCLMKASFEAATLSRSLLTIISRTVLAGFGAERLCAPLPGNSLPAAASGSPTAIPDREARANACCRFAVRLTAQPHAVTESDREDLRRHGLKEEEILDVVFLVALVNGLGRWDRFLQAQWASTQ